MFRFKQFSICHDRSTLRVGTDGVLIGAWAGLGTELHNILDVGTGCGLVALMMAQRNPQAHITAIDIDHDSVVQARENFDASPWSDRIEAVERDFAYATKTYDFIVSNPPFFEEDTHAASARANIAKHTVTLSFDVLCSKTACLLTPGGRLSVIVPYTAASSFVATAATNRLYLLRRCDVRGSERRLPKRSMLEFTTSACTTEHTRLTLLNADNSFSSEYCELTKDFYLNI